MHNMRAMLLQKEVTSMTRFLLGLLLSAIIGLVGFAAACGDDGGDVAPHIEEPTAAVEEMEATEEPTPEATATPEPTEEPAVNINVNEWTITTDISSVPAGETLYVATNSGTIPHEVVYLRTDRPVDDLPIDDNDKVNRFAEGIEDLGVIRTDDLVPGATVRKLFDLPAGNYVLICNIPGHYRAGMFVAFTIQ